MSGGAYDYLYCWAGDADILLEKSYYLREMAEDLSHSFPNTEAAKDTEALNTLITHFKNEINHLSRPLYDVWHDYEWWRSADYSHERAEQAIAKYAEDKLKARQH